MSAKFNNQLTVSELIASLEVCRDHSVSVRFDFCGFEPSGDWHSYRGYYEDLAIGYEESSSDPRKVSDIIAMLRDALGKTLHGYKGGEWTVTGDTAVWVDSHGRATGTGVVGVRDLGYLVIIETECAE